MFWQQITQIAASFIFVIAIMLLLSWIIRKIGLQQKWQIKTSNNGNIKVLDNLFLDHKRRIVLLQFEQMRYMLLIDNDKAQLIDKIDEPNTKN